MATALNLTAPLKQDPESKQRLAALRAGFAATVQPRMDEVLKDSERVHFARVLVIEDRYLQVLTEFDGDPAAYTRFFLEELPDVFEQVFSLVEGAPPWEELSDEDTFVEYTRQLNVPSLGAADAPDDPRGYLFSAVGDLTVKQLKATLAAAPPA
jgi:hypothetical protein